jgi:hypothetical protein
VSRMEPQPVQRLLDVAGPAARAQDRASVLPAVLAGLAESAVLYLPLHDVATNEGHVVAGPMAHYSLFVPVFAGAVAAATRMRGFSRLLPAVGALAIGVGLTQGILWGDGDAVAVTTSVVLWLLVALRVFTLALRDWRDPISRSFGVGAAVLLAEIVLMGRFAEARSVLPVAVPQFLLASLASRAASLRLSTRAVTVARSGPELGGRPPAGGRRPAGMALLAMVTFGLLMGAAILLGGREGGLVVLGRAILSAVLPVLAYVLLPVARFLLEGLVWLFALLNIDLSPLRSLADTIENFRVRPPDATGPGGGAVGRVLALVVLLALGFLLVRTIRARWQGFERKGGLEEEPLTPIPMSIFSSRRHRRRSRPGPELPADTVRRWYAEALLVLERLGLPKPPARTPGEYLRQVSLAFPECAPGFTALTRAYEDVRYGSLRFDPDTLGKIEANRRLAMAALGNARKLEEEGND